jgi:hypothetical protein
MNAPVIGAVVGVTFGSAWGIAGAMGLKRRWRLWAVALSVGISATLVAALSISESKAQAGTFRGNVYGFAATFEVVAIVAAVPLLRRHGRSDLLMPVIGLIVGLHFLGLWQATDLVRFVWVALAMCFLCGLAAFIPVNEHANARWVLAGFGSALVLWAAGVATLWGG